MSSALERAILCERLGWRVLPHELDEAETRALVAPLELLQVYRLFQRYGRDVASVTEEGELDVIAWVERLRAMRGAEDEPDEVERV